MTAHSFRGFALGIAFGVAATRSGWTASKADVDGRPAPPAQESVISLHLATYEVTPDGSRVPSTTVQRALMQFDCATNRYRRLGADVERPDGVVMILDSAKAGQPWRTAVDGDPEFLQIRASCATRR